MSWGHNINTKPGIELLINEEGLLVEGMPQLGVDWVEGENGVAT